MDPEYATQRARENAVDRGVAELAELIATRVALALNDAPGIMTESVPETVPETVPESIPGAVAP
jgi:hypothetical protein